MTKIKFTPATRFGRYMSKSLYQALRGKGMTKAGFYRVNATLCSPMTFQRVMRGENVGCHLLAEVADKLDLQLLLVPKNLIDETENENQD